MTRRKKVNEAADRVSHGAPCRLNPGMTTNEGYVQTRCPRCGAGAWALPTYAVPCQSCGTPVGPIGAAASAPTMMAYQQPPVAAPQQAPAPSYQAPQMFNQNGYGGTPGFQAPYQPPAGNPMPYQPPAGTPAPMPQATQPVAAPPAATNGGGHNFAVNVGGFKIPFKVGGAGGGVSKFKVIGGVVLAIVLAIGGVIFKMKFGTTAKGNISYSSLGVDRKHPDADALIAALEKPATKWKRDAMWYSANFLAVDADGKIDYSKGAEIVYISENGVQSASKSTRKDSIKKYKPGSAGVNGKDLWGATDAWTGVERHPEPKCKIKDVMAIVGKTLPKGKTVRVTFDPKFADYYAWRVISSDPKIDTQYSFDDCSVIE